ncbi:pyridoxal-dependent decarboxylase [Gorgonomyces haynaldii]|nr:pyridoxal-dependent decarboxylase [Gorgonomyces haynaldii]
MKEIPAVANINLISQATTKLAIKETSKNAVETRSIETLLKTQVLNTTDYDSEDPFYVGDMGSVISQYQQWKRFLPRVEPFYAVKCNPDNMVIKTLYEQGTGFDCASKAEIQLALDHGAQPEQIIFANPCKQVSHIRYAAAKGVKMMTFDNADELYKVKLHMPDAQMVLRILTDDSKSICRFGIKFGASLTIVPDLLKLAKELEINVIGISFHVGSGCFDASAFGDAVHLARKAFDIGEHLGFNFTLLDIGGGFPGQQKTGLQFADVADVLRPAIDTLFPAQVRVIAEPGRYFVSSAFSLAVNIIARRVVQRDQSASSDDNPDQKGLTLNDHPAFMYYINDGMYGSFNCITFDHAHVYPQPLLRGGEFCLDQQMEGPLYPCSIWGPTCDSIDCMGREFFLNEMHIGDWLVFHNMGAYTMAAASTFNGFRKSSIIYTNTKVQN